MAKLKILTIPHPSLKTPATPVKEISKGMVRLAGDMLETMHSYPRCVGIAAPQVDNLVRMIAVDVSCYPKPHPNHGPVVIINPVIKNSSGSRTGREGCLSVPELTGNVTRAETVSIEGSDIEGKTISINAEGFEAVVFQHEVDHLDGILFLDRVASLKTDVFRRRQS